MAKQYSVTHGDHTEYAFWLVFDRHGNLRMTRGEPGLDRSERAMSLIMQVPASLFSTPALKGTIVVEATPEGSKATVDVRLAETALKEALGIDIDLRVNHLEEGTN